MATIALDIGGTKIASAIFFPDGSMMFNRKRLLKGRTGHEVGKLAADILAKTSYRSTQKPYTRRRNRCLHPRYRLLPNQPGMGPQHTGLGQLPPL